MKQKILKLIRSLGYDITRRPSPDLRPYAKYKPGEFYNVGAGQFRHPYWVNVDFKSNWYSHSMDIEHDLMSLEPLPIESNSAECVYSSHTVEHISDEAAQTLFDEAYRILKPGGVLRVTTPNIELAYRAYLAGDRSYFYWADKYSQPAEMARIGINTPMNRASIEQLFLYHFSSAASAIHINGSSYRIHDSQVRSIFRGELSIAESLNYCISFCKPDIQAEYPGNHCNWWTKNKMYEMFRNSGFMSSRIFLSAYGQSIHPAMRDINYFDNTHPKISLYMEAVK